MNSIYRSDEDVSYLKLADSVFDNVKSAVYWVYRNIYRERISRKDGVQIAMTALFEAKQADPSLSDAALVEEAVRVYRGYLWAKGTPAYEAIRMATTGITRAKLYADSVTHFPWGAEVTEPSALINVNDAESLTVGTLFEKLESQIGTELALIYVLHNAYDWSLMKITKHMLGVSPDDRTVFAREYRRVLRLMEGLEKIIEACYVSREGS